MNDLYGLKASGGRVRLAESQLLLLLRQLIDLVQLV